MTEQTSVEGTSAHTDQMADDHAGHDHNDHAGHDHDDHAGHDHGPAGGHAGPQSSTVVTHSAAAPLTHAKVEDVEEAMRCRRPEIGITSRLGRIRSHVDD